MPRIYTALHLASQKNLGSIGQAKITIFPPEKHDSSGTDTKIVLTSVSLGKKLGFYQVFFKFRIKNMIPFILPCGKGKTTGTKWLPGVGGVGRG